MEVVQIASQHETIPSITQPVKLKVTCKVPLSCLGSTPCSIAAAIYIAITGITAPFMVIETDILSRGMPSNSTYTIATDEMVQHTRLFISS